MPVFEAKNLDCEFEGHAFLAAILHPTQDAQVRARTHGRARAARASLMADPTTMESHFPSIPCEIEVEPELS